MSKIYDGYSENVGTEELNLTIDDAMDLGVVPEFDDNEIEE